MTLGFRTCKGHLRCMGSRLCCRYIACFFFNYENAQSCPFYRPCHGELDLLEALSGSRVFLDSTVHLYSLYFLHTPYRRGPLDVTLGFKLLPNFSDPIRGGSKIDRIRALLQIYSMFFCSYRNTQSHLSQTPGLGELGSLEALSGFCMFLDSTLHFYSLFAASLLLKGVWPSM